MKFSVSNEVAEYPIAAPNPQPPYKALRCGSFESDCGKVEEMTAGKRLSKASSTFL